MSNAVVGAIRVNLGADTAQFQTAMKGVQASMAGFGKQLAVAAGAMTAAATAAGAAMAATVNRMSKSVAETGDVADRLGVPVESLQQLRHAAEMSGVGIKNFDVAFRRFIRRSSEAARGTGAAKDAFKELGVELTNSAGKMRTSEAIFHDVADAMAKIQDPSNKLRLAFKMFDVDGAALVKMFENGSEGIKKFRQQAIDLGIVLSEDTVRSSQRFQDSVNLMTKLMEGFGNKLYAGILPAFERMAAKLLDVAQNSQAVDAMVRGVSSALNVLTASIGLVLDNLHHLVDLFRVFVVAKTVQFAAALAGGMITLAKSIRIAGLATMVLTSLTRMKLTTFLLLGAVIAKLTGQFENLTGWLQETSRRIYESLPESLRDGFDAASQKLNELGNQLMGTETAASNSLATYLRVAEEAANSFETVGQSANAATSAWKTTVDATKEARDAVKDTALSMQDVGNTLQHSISGNFQSIIDGSKGMRDIVGDVLSDLGRMMFNASLSTIFGGGGGLSFAGLPGFANGGSFQVGGTGGIDSQLVAFRASPNERVTITKPGQEGGGGGGVVINNHIDATGADVAAIARLENAIGQLSANQKRVALEAFAEARDQNRI